MVAYTLTSIVQDPPSSPMLDDHGQRSHSRVNLHVCPNHPSIFQSQGIVNIHITGELQLGIPYLYDRNFSLRYADYLLHAIYQSSVYSFGIRRSTHVLPKLWQEGRPVQGPSSV